MSHTPAHHRVTGSAQPTATVTSNTPTSTDRHAILIEHGWRTDLWGRWVSPDPAEARFSFTLAAAWRQHSDRPYLLMGSYTAHPEGTP